MLEKEIEEEETEAKKEEEDIGATARDPLANYVERLAILCDNVFIVLITTTRS